MNPHSRLGCSSVEDGSGGAGGSAVSMTGMTVVVTDIYFCLACVRHCAKFFARVTPFNTFNISEVGSVVFSIL